MKPPCPSGATPLDPAWEADLIPSVGTMAELGEFEEQNILAALQWALKDRRLPTHLLTVHGIRRLHRRMFGDVWRWAGAFRIRDLNLGIDWGHVPIQTKLLCDDVAFWIEHHTFGWIELAVRFHHRLVSIHPFLNGNGRHARLAADLLLTYHDQPMLAWGKADLVTTTDVRAAYIGALKRADAGDLDPLIAFARSGA